MPLTLDDVVFAYEGMFPKDGRQQLPYLDSFTGLYAGKRPDVSSINIPTVPVKSLNDTHKFISFTNSEPFNKVSSFLNNANLLAGNNTSLSMANQFIQPASTLGGSIGSAISTLGQGLSFGNSLFNKPADLNKKVGLYDIGGYLSLASGVAGLAGNYMEQSKTTDTSSLENLLAGARVNSPLYGDSIDLLANDMASTRTLNPNLTQKDLGGGDDLGDFSNILSATGSGAMAGSMFGPVGTAVGAGVGFLSSGIATSIKRNKAKKEAARLNTEIQEVNAFNRNSFLNRLNNIKSNQAMMIPYLSALGGPLQSNGANWDIGVKTIEDGGTHEENPFGGVQVGVDEEGNPDLVEEGEVIWDDYVFSNRLQVPGTKETYADRAKKITGRLEKRPNDSITKKTVYSQLDSLRTIQEQQRQQEQLDNAAKMFALGGWERYAPIIGSGANVVTDLLGLTNKPDYSDADRLEVAGNSLRPIGYRPTSYRMPYIPMDTVTPLNQMSSNLAATRRAISQGNPFATRNALLALDSNYIQGLGQIATKAQEYNSNERAKALAFNAQQEQTDIQNAQRAELANLESDRYKVDNLFRSIQYRNALDNMYSNARMGSWNTFLSNLGSKGKEDAILNMLSSGNIFSYDKDGNLIFMGDKYKKDKKGE